MDELRREDNLNDLKELDNTKIWVEQMISGDLKEAINLFIWRWGHPQLTLAQAERISVDMFNMLVEMRNK